MTDPGPDARSRRAVAASYRELRTRELNGKAEAAVGGPVEAAGSFNARGSMGTASQVMKFMIPVVGWIMFARERGSGGGLERVQILAVDGERLYAIGPGDEVLESWSLAEVEFVGIERQGTDHRIELRERSGGETRRFWCSSLRTNPWAAAVVRRLGGEVPEAIGEPESLEAYEVPERETDM